MNLLLVDDEAFALEAVRNAISWETLGFHQVFSCSNITSAKEICLSQPIHIIICDIEMPNGTGMELAKWIFHRQPDTQIIFLTCHSEFHYAKEAISYRAFAYLLKPFDTEELGQTIWQAVQQIQQKAKKDTAHSYSTPEHFWQLLVRNFNENTEDSQIMWSARQNGISFNPDMVYTPVLFYLVSPPSPDADLYTLFFSVKNVINELLLSPDAPPAIELDSRFFLALIPGNEKEENLSEKSGILSRFFKEHFQVSLQMIVGNMCGWRELSKQLEVLKTQVMTALSDIPAAETKENPEQIVKKIVELVKDNKTISREELAKQVFLSPDYMAKLFKKETGKKISEYLSEVKLEDAKYRLAETDENISSIASSLAYSNFSYFSKMFRAETGMSPGEYRKQFQKGL